MSWPPLSFLLPSFPHFPWCPSSPPPSLLYPTLIPPQLFLNTFSYHLPLLSLPAGAPWKTGSNDNLSHPVPPLLTWPKKHNPVTQAETTTQMLSSTSKILCPLLSHPWHVVHFHSNNPKPSYLFYPVTSICEILRKKNHWLNQQLLKYKTRKGGNVGQ